MTQRALLGLIVLVVGSFSSARVVDQPLFVRPPQIQSPELTAPVPAVTRAPAGPAQPLPVTLPAVRGMPTPTPASGRPAASGGLARPAPAQPQTRGVKSQSRVLGLKTALGRPTSGSLTASSTVLSPSLGFKPLSIVFKRGN